MTDDKSKVHELAANDFVIGPLEIGKPPVRTYANLPANHPFYAKVGRAASEWSHLEHLLDLIIWKLLGADPAMGACVTSQIMGVGPRCRAIGSLGTLKGLTAETLKAFRTLMSESYAVADLRNRIVHDPWLIETSSQQPAQFKAMPYTDKHYGIKDIEPKEIDRTLDKIKKLQEKASKLHAIVQRELSTSP